MDLLGAVGIEDELQDGVPQCIDLISRAGVNIWMITGDKPETAIAIGRMCGLLKPQHEIETMVKVTKTDTLRLRLTELSFFFAKKKLHCSSTSDNSVDESGASSRSWRLNFFSWSSFRENVRRRFVLTKRKFE